LRALARIASGLGQRVWIVGGAARDLLLARGVPEVDAAVSGNAEAIARAMESAGFGRAVALSPAAPRVFRVAGRREVDLAEIEGASIEEDLARRDFTVNAMAFDLTARKWIDPFGGLADLSAGRLRQVAPSNLAEDPLRVLRAARFIATHGLRPDADTSRAARRVAPALATVAAERLRAEWIKIL
jgi:poly(A) polymerase